MAKLFAYIILFLISGLIIFFIRQDSSIVDLAINILAATLIILLDKIIENWKFIWLWLLTNTRYRNEKIRFSVSYLFKIKINDKYLLVKGKRVANQYQPVGGVFKRFKESYYALENLNVTDDDNIPIDDISFGDLRIKLPAQNATKFLKWYNSQLGREVSPYREFHEELIRPEIVKYVDFPYLNYIHRKRHTTKIHFSEHFKCFEILIAEIFDLMPNEEQIVVFKRLIENQQENGEYIWANEDQIIRLGVIPGKTNAYTISPTANWII